VVEFFLNRNESFHNEVINLTRQKVNITAILFQPSQNGGIAAFMSFFVVNVLCLLVMGILLVEGVIGEVHEHVLKGCLVRHFDRVVEVRGKADKTFLVQVDLQRITAQDQHIQADVELKSIQQIRLV
jgi:hypothetical protein